MNKTEKKGTSFFWAMSCVSFHKYSILCLAEMILYAHLENLFQWKTLSDALLPAFWLSQDWHVADHLEYGHKHLCSLHNKFPYCTTCNSCKEQRKHSKTTVKSPKHFPLNFERTRASASPAWWSKSASSHRRARISSCNTESRSMSIREGSPCGKQISINTTCAWECSDLAS